MKTLLLLLAFVTTCKASETRPAKLDADPMVVLAVKLVRKSTLSNPVEIEKPKAPEKPACPT